MTSTALPWGRVRGMVPVSLCDWPGKVSCVLFAAGCNFHCPTCHNATLAWDWHPLPPVERTSTLDALRRRARWLDGITVSGGEPTCVPGIDELVGELAEIGLPIKVDSNGSSPHVLERLLHSNLAQTVAVDVKGPWSLYPALTGQTMSAHAAQGCLEQVFDLAREFSARVYFRCTKVPRLTEEDLAVTRAQVPDDLPLVFQNFVPPRRCE